MDSLKAYIERRRANGDHIEIETSHAPVIKMWINGQKVYSDELNLTNDLDGKD